MKNLLMASDSSLPAHRWLRLSFRRRSLVLSHLLVLAGYSLLTLLMTWPAAYHFNTAIPGDGFDGWQNYWNLWWVRQALLVRGINPFFTDYLYAPTGVSLLFHTLNIFNGLWTLPLQLIAGLAVAYNSIVFFSFVLAGYGGYLLTLHTLASLRRPLRPGFRPAAFVGGLIFTMAPFHMAHLLGHMQVFTMVWPPFYILGLLRTLEPWAVRPTHRHPWRLAALTGLFLILASLVDWYHTLYLLIFTGLVLGWTLVRRRSTLITWPRANQPSIRSCPASPFAQPVWLVAVIGLIFGLALLPLLLPMIREASRRPDLQTGMVQNVTLSADLLAFVTPSEMHPLWGAWARRLADNFSSTTSERQIFAGFVPLALALFIALRGRPAAIRFWSLITGVFFVLALGPYLHIGGQIFTIGGQPVPLPYLLFYHTIPFIGLTRSLSRYDLMVMLGLGILAATAVYQLTTLRAKNRAWLPYLVILLVCFEFLAIPYPISKIEIPAFYFQMAGQAEDYTIAELPMNWDRPTPLLHQTIHGKRLLTAYTSRDNPLELAWRTPVFQQWRYLSADIIDQPLAAIAPTIFFDFNLRYIVLDFWQMPPGPEREATLAWTSMSLPGVSPVYDDGRLVVYQAPPRQAVEPYLALGNGWSERQENNNGFITRTFTLDSDHRPEIFLHHPQNLPLALEITAAAESGTPELAVWVDKMPVGVIQLTGTFTSATVNLPRQDNPWIKLSLGNQGPPVKIAVRRLGLIRK